ncbi:hypothetical protein DFH07DRAFT_573625 [Mycena maculata]|uniref:Fungal-type protein kinase domain-containing protein n=1 Tax=Mycena maculata TaxID=230809 RepID=A0AAD7IPT1_9AGAR|nr:hypothetical protein DFH07DRAFT_573625 [Mycena maculata]
MVYIYGVPQIPLEVFLISLLPTVDNGISAKVKAELMKQKRFPRKTNASETDRNDPLTKVKAAFDAIADVASTIFDDSVRMELVIPPCHPDEYSPHAELREVSHISDPERPWFGRVVPWMCDSDGDNPKYNHKDLIWNCYHVLREDPRRRFTLGVTIDAEEMRLWFFSRTHNVVSEPHNFATDPVLLIDLLCVMAFATPQQLGYDPTMSYFVDDFKTVQFKLSLNDVVYVTKKLLSDNRTDVICGRATRVWEAYREDDPNRTSVVIKDLWTSIDVMQEGAQLLDLHERLHALEDPGTPRPPGDYFLSVVAHGFVQLDGVDDHTIDVMMRGHIFPGDAANHAARKHYRIVFKEVGVAINKIQSISDVMRALADATRALALLHRLGLLHRDVSAGNILFVDGGGKLTDLEYLQSFKGTAGQTPSDPDIVEHQNIPLWKWPQIATCGWGTPCGPGVKIPVLRGPPSHSCDSTPFTISNRFSG